MSLAPTLLGGNRSTNGYEIVAFGGSAGAINALVEILALIPAGFPIPILVVQHLAKNRQTSVLPRVLGKRVG